MYLFFWCVMHIGRLLSTGRASPPMLLAPGAGMITWWANFAHSGDPSVGPNKASQARALSATTAHPPNTRAWSGAPVLCVGKGRFGNVDFGGVET